MTHITLPYAFAGRPYSVKKEGGFLMSQILDFKPFRVIKSFLNVWTAPVEKEAILKKDP